MVNAIYLDEIVEIEEFDEIDTIDITVSGDNLFFANGILTHNSGANNSDVDMTDISESFGTAAIADFMIAIINTEELQNLNQLMIKQLKNRYRDLSLNKRFVVGIDRKHMKLYDVENIAQDDIIDSGQQESNSMEEIYAKSFSKKKSFDGFTV